MGKKHNDDTPGRRGRSNDRSTGNAGGSSGFRKFSARPNEGGSSNRSGDEAGRGRDFPSRPTFGRPGGGRPSSGGSFGGDKRFGRGEGSNSFGSQRNFAPRQDAGDRRPFNRDNADRRPMNRDNDNRPSRSFDRDAPRRFDNRNDDRRASSGYDSDRRDERPARPYEPKANWPGQPYRQEGKPAVPRGTAGERNRKFKKVSPFEQDTPTDRTPAPREEAPRHDERREEAGPDREIRPARPFDYRSAPSGYGRDEQRNAPERPERGERRESGFGNRSFGERPSFGNRPGAGERGASGNRNSGPRDFGDKRESRFGDKREPRAGADKRPTRDPLSNRADKPKRGEIPGEAPAYSNLQFYDQDKTRGNKRRRNEEEGNDEVRLNRYIANAGICSRREADALIAAGEIKVNGEVVTEMGYQVQPTDTVQYGKTNLKREKLVYVLLNKPKDFITTTEDPEGRKTVMDLVATASKERIFPVGRLDRNTTGLLLFTNDGEVAQKLSHPSHKNKKIYQAELSQPLSEDHLRQISEGLELEDGKAEIDDVAVVAGNPHFVGIELHIGRNRIVRRIFEHLGYEVVALDRVQYAGLTKKDLPRGKWRFLTEREVIRLKYFL
ncbi:pseudouridine synthase [Hymenobacter jejuensis]|nr:pseudouridine synthase [Hymenobacter jejuensis]